MKSFPALGLAVLGACGAPARAEPQAAMAHTIQVRQEPPPTPSPPAVASARIDAQRTARDPAMVPVGAGSAGVGLTLDDFQRTLEKSWTRKSRTKVVITAVESELGAYIFQLAVELASDIPGSSHDAEEVESPPRGPRRLATGTDEKWAMKDLNLQPTD